MPMIKNRRRRYVVEKKLQTEFTFLMLVQMVIPTLIFGVFIYLGSKMYLSCIQSIIGNSAISDPYVDGILNFLLLSLAGFLIVVVLLLIFLGIRFSHHVAGPIYRLKRDMKKLAKGDKIEHLQFRKTDMLNGIDEQLNIIAKKLNQIKS